MASGPGYKASETLALMASGRQADILQRMIPALFHGNQKNSWWQLKVFLEFSPLIIWGRCSPILTCAYFFRSVAKHQPEKETAVERIESNLKKPMQKPMDRKSQIPKDHKRPGNSAGAPFLGMVIRDPFKG